MVQTWMRQHGSRHEWSLVLGMGDSPRFEIDYRRVNESYRTFAGHLRSEVDRILREEWHRAKHELNKHRGKLNELAAKLVSERQLKMRN